MSARSLVAGAVWSMVFVAVAVVSFVYVYRPWALTWGATDEEVSRAMPGDDIVREPNFDATRAITINARPDEAWPWIVQIGYRRAGFYSYDRLDNDGIPSAERILPEYQRLGLGDRIPVSESHDIRVVALEPNRSLVTVFETSTRASWVWGLYPLGDERTRLVIRLRVELPGTLARVFYDAFEIVMMRKHMLGIKARAEA